MESPLVRRLGWLAPQARDSCARGGGGQRTCEGKDGSVGECVLHRNLRLGYKMQDHLEILAFYFYHREGVPAQGHPYAYHK